MVCGKKRVCEKLLTSFQRKVTWENEKIMYRREIQRETTRERVSKKRRYRERKRGCKIERQKELKLVVRGPCVTKKHTLIRQPYSSK